MRGWWGQGLINKGDRGVVVEEKLAVKHRKVVAPIFWNCFFRSSSRYFNSLPSFSPEADSFKFTFSGSPVHSQQMGCGTNVPKRDMNLLWFPHASDARQWESVIYIWNSACLRILLDPLYFELTTHPPPLLTDLKKKKVLESPQNYFTKKSSRQCFSSKWS